VIEYSWSCCNFSSLFLLRVAPLETTMTDTTTTNNSDNDHDPIEVYDYIRYLFVTPHKLQQHTSETRFSTVTMDYLDYDDDAEDDSSTKRSKSSPSATAATTLRQLLEGLSTSTTPPPTTTTQNDTPQSNNAPLCMSDFWKKFLRHECSNDNWNDDPTPPSPHHVSLVRQALLEYCHDTIDDNNAVGIPLRSHTYSLREVERHASQNDDPLTWLGGRFDRTLYQAAFEVLPEDDYVMEFQTMLVSRREDGVWKDPTISSRFEAAAVSTLDLLYAPPPPSHQQTLRLMVDPTWMSCMDRLFRQQASKEKANWQEENIEGYVKTILVIGKKKNDDDDKNTKEEEPTTSSSSKHQPTTKKAKAAKDDDGNNTNEPRPSTSTLLPDPIFWFTRVQELARIPELILTNRKPWHLDVSSPQGAQVRNALEQISTIFCAGGSQHIPSNFWHVNRWKPLFVTANNDNTSTQSLLTPEQQRDMEASLQQGQLPIAALLAIAQPAPFGTDGATVFDATVRKAHEIAAERIPSTLVSHTTPIVDTKVIERGMKPSHHKIWTYHLYKLHIYGPGGKFLPHVDTIHDKRHVATLVVRLPSAHQGGALVVRQGTKHRTLDFSRHATQYLQYGAFFTDCTHEIEPVTEGWRVVLQYDIYEEEDTTTKDRTLDCSKLYGPKAVGVPPHPSLLTENQKALQQLVMALENLMTQNQEKKKPVGFLLRHKYPLLALSDTILRGADRLIYDTLQASSLVSQGKTSLALYGAILVARDPELSRGDCSADLYVKAIVVEDILEATSYQSDGKDNAVPRDVLLVPDTKATYQGDYLIEQDRHYTGNETEAFYYAYYKACLVLIPEGYQSERSSRDEDDGDY
jgi:hypothetical protein